MRPCRSKPALRVVSFPQGFSFRVLRPDAHSRFSPRSKDQLQASLHAPRRRRAGDSSEGRVPEGRIGVVEVHLIERVEHLPAELHYLAFDNRGVLEDGKIPVLHAGAPEDSLTGIPIAAGDRIAESAGVEPAAGRTLIGREVARSDAIGL